MKKPFGASWQAAMLARVTLLVEASCVETGDGPLTQHMECNAGPTSTRLLQRRVPALVGGGRRTLESLLVNASRFFRKPPPAPFGSSQRGWTRTRRDSTLKSLLVNVPRFFRKPPPEPFGSSQRGRLASDAIRRSNPSWSTLLDSSANRLPHPSDPARGVGSHPTRFHARIPLGQRSSILPQTASRTLRFQPEGWARTRRDSTFESLLVNTSRLLRNAVMVPADVFVAPDDSPHARLATPKQWRSAISPAGRK